MKLNRLFTIGILTICIFLNSCSVCKIDTKLQVETANLKEVSISEVNIYTDIVINASSKKVWAALRNFENMHNWSTSLKGLSGDIKNGGSIIIKYDLGNGQVIDIPRSPLIYEEGVLFGWIGDTPLPGLKDNHIYKVVPISKCQTRFIQTEIFTGNNPNFTPLAVGSRNIERYKIFNKELKKEVEKY